jgi:hypothetical protein
MASTFNYNGVNNNLIGQSIMKEKGIYDMERNRFYINEMTNNHLNKRIQYICANDVLQQKFKLYQRGELNYTKDNSIKSDINYLLNEYGEPYEEGRSTLLWDSVNKIPINVGGYLVKNDKLPRYPKSIDRPNFRITV